MVDWSKPIEWSNGEPSRVIHTIPLSDSPPYRHVALPRDRTGFHSFHIECPEQNGTDVNDDGYVLDLFRIGASGEPIRYIPHIRNVGTVSSGHARVFVGNTRII